LSKTFKHPGTWVAIYDLHYPLVDWPTFNAAMDFMSKNEIAGFIWGGDQFDNNEISHHTKGKPIFRERAAYKRNTDGFNNKILKPLEEVLGNEIPLIYITGNHERFEQDLIECHPELEGTIEHDKLLHLEERGWQIVPLGHSYKLGKLAVIHGDILTGIGNQAGLFPSKKAVEIFACSVLAGHTHASQSYTRVSPVTERDKWMGWIAPIAGKTNPSYLRNRPTAWMNGFVIIEVRADGTFNLYPVIVCADGTFSYGGHVYGGKR